MLLAFSSLLKLDRSKIRFANECPTRRWWMLYVSGSAAADTRFWRRQSGMSFVHAWLELGKPRRAKPRTRVLWLERLSGNAAVACSGAAIPEWGTRRWLSRRPATVSANADMHAVRGPAITEMRTVSGFMRRFPAPLNLFGGKRRHPWRRVMRVPIALPQSYPFRSFAVAR